MKTTVYFYDFKREFKEIRPNNFTDEGLIVLWDYLEEYEQSTGEELELDIIALCCDYTEELPRTIAHYYNIEVIAGKDDPIKTVLDHLEKKTSVVGVTDSGRIIYQNF
jgi:glucuronate isomerase